MQGFVYKIVLLLFLIKVSAINASKKPILQNTSGNLKFIENKGQVSDQFSEKRSDVLFVGNVGETNFYLKKNGISYQFSKVLKWKELDTNSLKYGHGRAAYLKISEKTEIYRLDIEWLNCNSSITIQPENRKEEMFNYYSVVCPNGVTGVRSYEKIKYKNLYNGVDLIWYESKGNLKYDYMVAPGKDYKQIAFKIKGASEILINKKGELVIETPHGKIVEEAPLVIQNQKELKSRWKLKDNVVSFEIEGINPNYPFVIDPLIRLWGTYFGGNLWDEAWYTVTDASGNVYSTGDTQSLLNIATVGAHQTIYGGGSFDVFLSKFNINGNLIWATYYGGNNFEIGNLLGIDPNGDVVVVGASNSNGAGVIATPGTHQTTLSATSTWGDGFVAKFNANGVRIWGTYYGGTGDEWPIGLAFDSFGNIYFSGETSSNNLIATPGCHQFTKGSGQDGFIAKLSPAGNLLWGSYYGGNGNDNVITCNVDSQDNLYLIGYTTSNNNIATVGAHQASFGGGQDGFVARFTNNGIRIWASYYGGNGIDWLYNCVFDATDNVYIAGTTSTINSTLIATPGVHQTTYGGGPADGMLLKINPNGNRIWCTYYGGTANETNNWCTIDIIGNVYLTGSTNSNNTGAISTPCAYQQSYAGGGLDSYLVKFDLNANRLWGTYYGGTGIEEWPTCYVDFQNNVYITGRTNSAVGNVLGTSSTHQPTFGGGQYDGFITKFDGCIPAAPSITTPTVNLQVCIGSTTTINSNMNCSVTWYDAPNGGNILSNTNFYTTPSLTTSTTYYVEEASCGVSSTRTPVTVTVLPTPTLQIVTTSTTICSGSSVTLSPVGATTFTWINNNTLNTVTPTAAIATPVNTQTYYLNGSNGNCVGSGSVVINVIQTPTLDIGPDIKYLCSGTNTTIIANGAQSYSWLPNYGLSSTVGSLVNASPGISTVYTLTGNNSLGTINCSSSITFTILVIAEIQANTSPSIEICQGEEALISVTGGNIHTWWPIEGLSDPNGSTILASPNVTTVYSVQASSNGMCPTTKTVLVKVNPLPVIDAGLDTTINMNESIFIAAVSDGVVKWISGLGINCSTCNITQVFPDKSNCYVAEAISSFGCRSTDEVCIEITKQHEIYIPNCFTPNDDGVNDVFKVYANGITEIEISIYDRWGHLIYNTDEIEKGWNGNVGGEKCADGVYLYKIWYKTISGVSTYKTGHITSIKS